MRAVKLSFLHMLKLIRHDMMLFAAGLAPLLAGIAIKFGVPFMEKMLVSYTGAEAVLTPYYGLFDIFFASIAPAMFGFIAAMVMLEERDDHIDRYLVHYGLGAKGISGVAGRDPGAWCLCDHSSFTAVVSAFRAVCRRDRLAGSDGNPAGDHHCAVDRSLVFQ